MKRKVKNGRKTTYIWKLGVLATESMNRAKAIASQHGTVSEVFLNNEQGFEFEPFRIVVD